MKLSLKRANPQPMLVNKQTRLYPTNKVYCPICKFTTEVSNADEFVVATLSHFADRNGHVLMLNRPIE